jgi:TonB family protein
MNFYLKQTTVLAGFFLALCFAFPQYLKAQKQVSADTNLFIVDPLPHFPGGDSALQKYFHNNLKYPDKVNQNIILKTVYISFKVDTNGQVNSVRVLRSVGHDWDKEAIRVIQMMPRWEPARLSNGKPIASEVNIPVKFHPYYIHVKDTINLDNTLHYSDTTQTLPIEDIDEESFIKVYTPIEAQFHCGDDARNKFLMENIIYPDQAKREGIQGTVYVKFVVEKDGSISNVEIIRGIGGGCDEEVIRVVKMMPNWERPNSTSNNRCTEVPMAVKFTLISEQSDNKSEMKKKRSKR